MRATRHLVAVAATCAVVIAPLVAASVAQAAPLLPRSGKVVRVLSGETILVNVAGKNRTLRIYGIDAPRGSECYAVRSRAELASEVKKGQLLTWAYRGVKPPRTARSFVGVVNHAGLDLGAMQVTMGAARAVNSMYASFERAAKGRPVGLWTVCGTGTGKSVLPDLVGRRFATPFVDDTTSQKVLDVCRDGRFRLEVIANSADDAVPSVTEGTWKVDHETYAPPDSAVNLPYVGTVYFTLTPSGGGATSLFAVTDRGNTAFYFGATTANPSASPYCGA